MEVSKNTQLYTLLQQLSKHYLYDLYIENYTYPTNIYKTDDRIKNTFEFYSFHHPDFNIKILDKLSYNVLEIIVKNDKTIKLDNHVIFKELYKIILLIDQTFITLNKLKSSKYPNQYFAHMQSDKKAVRQEKRHLKYMRYKSNSFISSHKEVKANLYFYTMYEKNPLLTKFFLNVFVIQDMIRLTDFQNETDISKLIFITDFFNYYLIQKTTPKAIIKSLGILLHYEFKTFLGIKDTTSKELIAELIPYIFDCETPNDYEFNKHILLNCTLDKFPIFTASKKSPITQTSNKQLLKMINKIFKDLKIKGFVSDSLKATMLDSYLTQSHIQFLYKYPVEFFRINPKYSSLF